MLTMVCVVRINGILFDARSDNMILTAKYVNEVIHLDFILNEF